MKDHQSLEAIQAVLHSGNDYRSGKKIALTSKNKRAALEPKWRSIPELQHSEWLVPHDIANHHRQLGGRQ